MPRGIILPARVTLPTVPDAPVGSVYDAIGITRTTAMRWRRRHGFPAGDRRDRIEVAAVAAFLVARGVTIRWS